MNRILTPKQFDALTEDEKKQFMQETEALSRDDLIKEAIQRFELERSRDGSRT